MNLRDYARGKPCFIRVPGCCSHDPEQTVWCHVRLVSISGAGWKSPDLCGAFGCTRCHMVVDGQQSSDYSYDQRRLMLLEAMVRSQAYLVSEGIIRW